MNITRGETRGITQARIHSIHFPAIHYFALFIGRCVNCKHDLSTLCASGLIILKSVVLSDKKFNMRAIIARRLRNNSLVGDIVDGVYATYLDTSLDVSIRENDSLLPPSYLDYESMEGCLFLERETSPFLYSLIINKNRVIHIVFPAPAFLSFQEKQRYLYLRRMPRRTRW